MANEGIKVKSGLQASYNRFIKNIANTDKSKQTNKQSPEWRDRLHNEEKQILPIAHQTASNLEFLKKCKSEKSNNKSNQ